MAPPAITVKSFTSIRDDLLRTIRNGLIQLLGISNPNVSINSDFGVIATALANEAAVAESNVVIAAQNAMPNTATGTYLDTILTNYGLSRRSASSAFGSVVITATASSLVPTGAQLQSATGYKYAVSTGGIYGNGASIQIQSLDTGSATNLDAGSALTWVSAPAFFAPTVLVSDTSPITGAVDAEDDETARARLLFRLANPPGAGNPSQLIQFALDSDPAVQTAFVCPAARGPSTVDITIVGYATSSSQNRNVDYSLLANKIRPYILGQLPQFVDGYVSTVVNYPIDVSIELSLPDPITANPAGPGGGFLDADPLAVTSAKPAIRVVDGYAISGNDPAIPQNTPTAFWIDCPIAPLSGAVYNVSYLSPVTLTLSSAQTSGSYSTFSTFGVGSHTSLVYITINAPFYQDADTNEVIQPGNWIFPTAINTSTYVSAFLSYVASMGPGERTNVAGLLPRALRQPRETEAWNYRLNNRLLKPIIESGLEVFDGAILFRGDAGTIDSDPFTDYSSLTTNSDPAYPLYAPPTAYLAAGTMQSDSYIFVPHNFGIYKQDT